MAAGAIAATISWTVATSSLDVRQARRLFPVCTAAAIAGYLAGSLLAGPIAGAVGAPALIGLEGLLFAAAAAVIAVLAQRHVGARWIPQRTARRSIAADVRVGFDEVRGSPLLRLVAAAYILLAILMFSVSFPYLRAARAAYPDEAELARILGIIAATITGDLVRRLARAGGPFLPAVRHRSGGPAPPPRLSRRVRAVGRLVLVRDRRRVHDRPAGDPARHLERGLERDLQRPAVDPSSPGDRVHGRRPGADRDRAGRHPAAAVHEPSRARSRSSGSAWWRRRSAWRS